MSVSAKHILTSASSGVHVGEFSLESEPGQTADVQWRVSLTELHGGRQEGSQLLEVETSKLSLKILPTRGMGILEAAVPDSDLRLGWDSPVKEVVHPNTIDLGARGGTGWLDGFNEYLVRCGLEWMGPPCEDAHHLANGEPPGAFLTLHGKIANIPVSELSVEIEEGSETKIVITGVTHERMMYGPKFALETKITIVPGKASFTVTDTITNLGGQTQEYQLLYHLNHGSPLMEDGAKWVAPIEKLAPRDEPSVAGVERYATYGPPRPGCLEQAFLCELHADAEIRTAAMLHNAAKDKAVKIGWSKLQMPYFTVWKAEHDPADGYVTGLEPCTGYPLPKPVARKYGMVRQLAAGESVEFELNFDLLAGTEAVAAGLTDIERIAGGREPEISTTPPSWD
ncbi:aldose 1-epimerase family protein [Calycomorphotria hydatis]|uniref:DUF4432 domain-containing protein n=1 Tax=Calycomorphotria hydatis TaxID=2528027 RepID=A0A517T7B1_9PLAN|nr:aldose 1-epimerase family protein [Calycomorphotria hydatis]QDT64263.1 hypothetical protein V22_14940 [Calycomorphotria hydatis]